MSMIKYLNYHIEKNPIDLKYLRWSRTVEVDDGEVSVHNSTKYIEYAKIGNLSLLNSMRN